MTRSNTQALAIEEALRLGWALENTGGGCMAFCRPDTSPSNPGGYWLVTDRDGSDIPLSFVVPAVLGRYTQQGDPIGNTAVCRDFHEAHRFVTTSRPAGAPAPREEQARQLLV